VTLHTLFSWIDIARAIRIDVYESEAGNVTLHTMFSWIYIAWAIRIDVYKSEARNVILHTLFSWIYIAWAISHILSFRFIYIYPDGSGYINPTKQGM
jgi:hypothetical protein